jgi:putative inorganic carbon (HCO3(-)) transporter
VISLRTFLASARAELPQATFARWASLFFTLSVLTFLISLAVSQAMLGVSALFYAIHLLRERPGLHFPPIRLPLALFCLGTVLSVFGAENPDVGWFAVRKLVLFVILLLGANLVVSGKHLEFLFRGLFLESALAGLVAAGQFILQYRAVQALHPGHIYASMTSDRITGFMGHWMNFGGQQMLVFAALSAFLLLGLRGSVDRAGIRNLGSGFRESSPFSSRQLLWWAVWLVVAVSIVLNFTRGVWLGCFVVGLYLVARWRPRWLLLVPVVIVIGYFAAPTMMRERVKLAFHPSQDPALSIRLEMWHVAGRMIRQHPWLGVGPNNIVEVYALYLPPGKSPEPGYHSHLHNNLFQFGAERGLPVLAAWAWMMGALGWHFWRLRRKLRARRWIADAAFAGWLALLVEGCFEFNFGTSPVLMLFLFIAAAPTAAERLELTTPSPSKVQG